MLGDRGLIAVVLIAAGILLALFFHKLEEILVVLKDIRQALWDQSKRDWRE